MQIFERLIGRGCTFLRPHKKRDALYEGLNDPQQAAGGGLLRGPNVVAGINRKCAMGVKDTRVEKLHAACEDVSGLCLPATRLT